MPSDANRGPSKIKNRMANSVNPDETALNVPSHLDLHCSHWYLFWSLLKGLKSSINGLKSLIWHGYLIREFTVRQGMFCWIAVVKPLTLSLFNVLTY